VWRAEFDLIRAEEEREKWKPREYASWGGGGGVLVGVFGVGCVVFLGFCLVFFWGGGCVGGVVGVFFFWWGGVWVWGGELGGGVFFWGFVVGGGGGE